MIIRPPRFSLHAACSLATLGGSHTTAEMTETAMAWSHFTFNTMTHIANVNPAQIRMVLCERKLAKTGANASRVQVNVKWCRL